MKKFRKSKSLSGFDKVNVDKMFSISGGSLTAWGRSKIGNNSYGYYSISYEQEGPVMYWNFKVEFFCIAGCRKVSV